MKRYLEGALYVAVGTISIVWLTALVAEVLR